MQMTEKTGKIKSFLHNYLVMVSIALLVVVTIIVEPKFLSVPNLINIVTIWSFKLFCPWHDLCDHGRLY